MHMKELYTAPDFTLILFSAQNSAGLSQDGDNEVDGDDLWDNS